MKNPANPGDFGTNGTRGVVLSGMSETTKRTLGADLIDLRVPWAKRIDPTHLAARPVDQRALRASRFGAEGGVERETTNSPAGIGTGCTGRKMTVALRIVCVVLVCAAFVTWSTYFGWFAGAAAALVEFALIAFALTMRDMAGRRASGGEGV